jgi:hypothetical protein
MEILKELGNNISIDKGVNVTEHSSLFENDALWWPYNDKISNIIDLDIEKLRVVTFSGTLVRIYIRSEDMKSYKDQITLTFGGKTIEFNVAFEIAISVCDEIIRRRSEISNSEIEYIIDPKCQQQVDAYKVDDDTL